jgi:glycosyltransferase involved in cell wall biosynthesis
VNAYVVITPAHNEQDFIERTLDSMVVQTVRPLKWVIVDDGSTDGTAEVVARYAARFKFIELVRKTRDADRNFARKVAAFNHGLARLDGLPYDYIGNIDADMSFGPDYFERIMAKFDEDAAIGISGGIVHTKFVDEFKTYDTTLDSVGGKVQLFRRQCFEDIGGYRPLKFGGIDATAEIMSRMNGWKVEKSMTTPAFEHRPTGFAYGNAINIKVCEGRRFYSLGYDPFFYLLRCIYRFREHPFLLGSSAAWLRYVYGMLRREAIALPADVVSYLRDEQRAKIRRQFRLRSK